MTNNSYEKEVARVKEIAGRIGHTLSYKEESPMVDRITCSCGWESARFFDGYEYALNDWMAHAEEAIAKHKAESSP